MPDLFAQVAAVVTGDDRALVASLLRLSAAEARCAATLRRIAGTDRWSTQASDLLAQAAVHDAHHWSYAGFADRMADCKSLPRPVHRASSLETIGDEEDEDADHAMLAICLVDLRALLALDLMRSALGATPDPERRRLAERQQAFHTVRIAHADHHMRCVSESLATGAIDPRAAAQIVAGHDRHWWDGVAQAGTLLAEASAQRTASAFA